MPLAKFQKKIAKVNEKVFGGIDGKLLQPFDKKQGDSKLYVLKNDAGTKRFTVLAVVEDFRAYDTDEGFAHNRIFEVPVTEPIFGVNKNKTFPEAVKAASHVSQYPFGEVWSIRNSIDGVQLVSTAFTYKIYGNQVGDKFNPNDLD